MTVTEYPPPPALAPFVEAFWSRAADQSTGSVGPERILPDGCLDIVVGPRQAIVVGAMTRPLLVPPADGGALIGVRFRPGMATAFLRIPAAALTDDRAPLEAVWPDGEEVADHVGSALGTDRAISRLAASLGVTRQHLARRFAAHVGVPPKTFCRVVRLWKVLRSTTGGRVNWAGLAADLGYSDQSHLVTEFRSLTGLTPGRWIASRPAGSKSPSRQPFGSLL